MALSKHRRRAHAKRRARRRISFLLVTTLTAVAAVGAGVLAELHLAARGTDPAAAAMAAIPGSRSAALLEQGRLDMILVDAASRTLSLVGTPKLAVNPAPPVSSSSSLSGAPTGPDPVVVNAAPPNPGTAQSTAWNMMPSFGFDPSTQFHDCLQPLWQRESGWLWDATNAVSGAYGIPQALPGDKMASAGADWQTDPATQIRWGLGYIKSVYGTPCGAWNHELAFGWY